MYKLLIISGPTATGKTGVAIKLAKKFNGELISADSRQIYRDMDIGTGKDHPKNIKINLIDIINPNEKFSVAQYRQLAILKIKEIHSKNKLPIIVGGTGQYIESIIHPRETFAIKPNYFLRFFINRLPIFLLQQTYLILDKKNYKLLNNSDVNNPRRLIRKIEIRLNRRDVACNVSTKNDFDILHISLIDKIDNIITKIDTRIQSRLNLGLIDEIKNLLKKYKWTDPGFNTLAYKEFKTGFTPKNINTWAIHEHQYARRQKEATPLRGAKNKSILLNNCINTWAIHEHQYARRQITWFKKYTPNYFIDISKPNYKKQIETVILKWYNQS